jgi:hypothetical protein
MGVPLRIGKIKGILSPLPPARNPEKRLNPIDPTSLCH